MWLLPAFSAVSRIAGRIFYRVRTSGASVPGEGPVLLVANHPNSLFDPVLVAAAARRPVRFLAKAPLFTDPRVGWMVRASGAIPVYRRQDDPAALDGNETMFRAVYAALAEGAAVGIFPEGTSHSGPALVPLKTGAARILLGAARSHDARPEVVPVGLVLRDKGVFRSEAMVVVGRPVPWEDLAHRGEGDVDAVRELTERIDGALRAVTVNTERWEDQPLVECAEAIWATAHGVDLSESERVRRLAVASRMLADARRRGERAALELAGRIERHHRRLTLLGLDPGLIPPERGVGRHLRRAAARSVLIGLPGAALGIAGWAAYFVPYQLTGPMASRLGPAPDQLSTYKLLVGIPLYAFWTVLVAMAVLFGAGPLAALLVLVLLPLIGYAGLRVREAWRGSWADFRRVVLLRSRRRLLERLRQEQRELAEALDDFVERSLTGPPEPT